MISPPEESLQVPSLPSQPSNDTDEGMPIKSPTDYLPPPLQPSVSEPPRAIKMASPVTKQPIPSVQTIESQSAWQNIGSSHLSASLGGFFAHS